GLKNCVQSSTRWVTKEGGTTPATGTIGTSTTAYANIIYDIYKVFIYTDAGVKSVSIDGKVLVSPASGQNVFYTVENLKAGNHKVTYTLKDGYSGEAILYTSEHVILPNLGFETSGMETEYVEHKESPAGYYAMVTLELSGTEPTPEPEPVEPEKESEWTVTTILLCVLVVLIAIMAVIVALRLNRN
ncbi:MAG: hypothetical protein IKQ93_08710, partial [Candidatus Methanomethylophilaceae archaeon]|nr:hypothetical protein [Candidatus Methanomethylophilaceae archaeon]